VDAVVSPRDAKIRELVRLRLLLLDHIGQDAAEPPSILKYIFNFSGKDATLLGVGNAALQPRQDRVSLERIMTISSNGSTRSPDYECSERNHPQ
jgi:hypothetical protein